MDTLQRLMAEVKAKQEEVKALRHTADVLEQEAMDDWAHIQRVAVELEEQDDAKRRQAHSQEAAGVFGVEFWG